MAEQFATSTKRKLVDVSHMALESLYREHGMALPRVNDQLATQKAGAA